MNQKIHVGALHLLLDFHTHIESHVDITELCMQMIKMVRVNNLMMENQMIDLLDGILEIQNSTNG